MMISVVKDSITGSDRVDGISRQVIERAIRDVVVDDDVFKRLRRMDWTLIKRGATLDLSGSGKVKTNLTPYETFEPLCILPAAILRILSQYVDWTSFGYSKVGDDKIRVELMAADVGYFLAVLHRAEQGGDFNLRKYARGVISVMRRGATADSIKSWSVIDSDTLKTAVSPQQRYSSIEMTNLYFAMVAMISYYLTAILPVMRKLAVDERLPWHESLATSTWAFYRKWRGVAIDGKPRDGMGDHGVRSGVALYKMRFVNGELEAGARKLLRDVTAIGDAKHDFFKFLCRV